MDSKELEPRDVIATRIILGPKLSLCRTRKCQAHPGWARANPISLKAAGPAAAPLHIRAEPRRARQGRRRTPCHPRVAACVHSKRGAAQQARCTARPAPCRRRTQRNVRPSAPPVAEPAVAGHGLSARRRCRPAPCRASGHRSASSARRAVAAQLHAVLAVVEAREAGAAGGPSGAHLAGAQLAADRLGQPADAVAAPGPAAPRVMRCPSTAATAHPYMSRGGWHPAQQTLHMLPCANALASTQCLGTEEEKPKASQTKTPPP